MVHYRRSRITGGTYFFTVNLRNRTQTLLVDHVDFLRDDRDFEAHVNYVHINPVKHGYVTRAADWAHTTLHRYIRDGVLPADWACEVQEGDFGEDEQAT